MRTATFAILAAGSVLTIPAAAQQPEELVELETVLVVGEQPGPGLWKVSKDDYVLWILAAHAPLPKEMRWRSAEIESRIAGSQEVLYGGGVGIAPNIGLLRALTLIPAAMNSARLPGERKLADVLPAETYARWRALREKYLPRDKDTERMRPVFALQRLRSAALRSSGLSGGPDVREVVGDLRKKHKVKPNMLPAAHRVVRVENPRAMFRGLSRLEMPDLACFTRELDAFEEELENARQRANAWARGDVATLRGLYREQTLEEALESNCVRTLMLAMASGEGEDAEHMGRMLADLEWHARWAGVQAEQEWLAAAEAALAKNSSTFAVLPLDDLLRSEGPLAKLRARGCVVEEPR